MADMELCYEEVREYLITNRATMSFVEFWANVGQLQLLMELSDDDLEDDFRITVSDCIKAREVYGLDVGNYKTWPDLVANLNAGGCTSYI